MAEWYRIKLVQYHRDIFTISLRSPIVKLSLGHYTRSNFHQLWDAASSIKDELTSELDLDIRRRRTEQPDEVRCALSALGDDLTQVVIKVT